MPLEWYGEDAKDRIRRAAAKTVAAWGKALVAAAREDLSVPNPPPHANSSVPGEFPRMRTGNLRAGVQASPAGLYAVMSEGRVVVGYTAAAFYGPILKERGRLWILNSLARLKWRTRGVLPGTE